MYPQRPPEQQRDREVRINRRIRAPHVLVMNAEGTNLGEMPLAEALRIAQECSLDLVEVSPKAMPPVCRIMDFGKYKYLMKKKAQKAKASQTVVELKELSIGYKTDENDIATRLRQAQKFLLEGNRVKFKMEFHGREKAHINLGRTKLSEIVGRIQCKAGVILQEGNRFLSVELSKA